MAALGLGPEDLQRFIVENQIDAQIVRLDVDTPTVQAAADAVGVDPGRIAKSLVFKAGGAGLLAIACGNTPIRRRALADHLGLDRRQIELASPEDVLELTGYEVGAVPPFGHRNPIETLMDAEAIEHDRIFAGGGGKRALLRVAPAEIKRVSQAQIIGLTG